MLLGKDSAGPGGGRTRMQAGGKINDEATAETLRLPDRAGVAEASRVWSAACSSCRRWRADDDLPAPLAAG
jgi:hypothetical protein